MRFTQPQKFMTLFALWGLLYTVTSPSWAVTLTKIPSTFSETNATSKDIKDTGSSKIPVESITNFVDVFEKIKQYYVTPISDEALFQAAIKGLTHELDAYSTLLSTKQATEFSDYTDAVEARVGIELIKNNQNKWVVDEVIAKSHASKQGIKSGDVVVEINNKRINDLTPEQVQDVLLGDAQSMLEVVVLKNNKSKTWLLKRDIKVEEELYPLQLPQNIGYIHLSNFALNTPATLITTVEQLKKPTLRGLIIDLRGNLGGLVSSAVDTAGLFLPEQTVVVRQRFRAEQLQVNDGVMKANIIPKYVNLPIVLLVDHDTASASEVFAAALQEYQRASLIGTPTRGKSSIQQILSLQDDSALKLTVGWYETPKGIKLNQNGLQPNLPIETLRVPYQYFLDKSKENQSLSAQKGVVYAKVITVNGPKIKAIKLEDYVECGGMQDATRIKSNVLTCVSPDVWINIAYGILDASIKN